MPACFSATCASPQNYTNLSSTSHTFEVRAVDAAGNIDQTPASYTWTIDAVAPETSITASPSNPSNSNSASFSFSSNKPGSFQCQLDGAVFTSCSTPQNYTNLSNGSHNFQVRAIDALGNTDPSPASYTWTIDTIAPDTNITAMPANPSNSSTPSFSFTSNEAGSFQCQLDGAGFGACTSPRNYTGLSEGSHNFQVQAIDLAGNPDPTPASYTWTVDVIAPETAITAAPNNPSNIGSAGFSFTSTEAGTFQCKLDGANFAPCASPQNYSGLAEGSHTFQVQATDLANNVDPTPATYTWTYTPVTLFPSAAVILTGSLQSGTAASLNADDNNFLAVNSTTSVNPLTTAWYGSFTGVSSSLSNLKITYKGKNSRNSTQTIAIWRWTDNTWVQLDSRNVSTTEIQITDLSPTGTLANYVSATGELQVRVRNTRNSQTFVTSGDLLKIVYDAP